MSEHFRTTDFGQAAFLLARGHALHQTEPNGDEVVFCFVASPTLLNAISDYSSNAPIACRDFFHALRKTKSLIRENTNGNLSHHTRR